MVTRFSVTDSTVVIEELSPGDERFRMGRENLPTEIPKDRVVSVAHVETNWWVTVPVVASVGLVIGYIVVLIATFDGFE